ncbi:MAG: amidase family protein [Anaerolineales bacterium]
MIEDLCDLSGHQIAERIRRREISATEVLDSTFARIHRVDGRSGSLEDRPPDPDEAVHVHAFLELTEELAHRQASQIDSALARGDDPGPLAGVPLAVKDIFCVQGTASTAGSRILANYRAPYSATSVERLVSAGALVVGKVNLDEFTFGSSNESSAFRPTPRNPWEPSRVPGGSSGGSAAAVAAGEAVLSLGTDTSGSIRQPAAFCGVSGLKPTYGRVSRYGLIAFASSLDCPGPIARDVTDLALALGAMSGEDRRDATAAAVPVPDYRASLDQGVRGLRIGISPDAFQLAYPDPTSGEVRTQGVDREMETAVREAVQALQAEGAEIVEGIPLSHARYAIPAYFVISRVEAASNLHRYDGVKYGHRHVGPVSDLRSLYRTTRGEGFGTQVKLRILMGMYVSAAQYEEQFYAQALRVRSLIRRDFEAAFDPHGAYRVHALLGPTTPTAAFPMNELYGDSVLMQLADLLTVPANHAGIPGLSIPCGLSAEGLPLGLQLLGPDFEEGTLFRIGRAYEKATEGEAWRAQRPKVLAG